MKYSEIKYRVNYVDYLWTTITLTISSKYCDLNYGEFNIYTILYILKILNIDDVYLSLLRIEVTLSFITFKR